MFGSSGWINETTFWFQSEATGYSHLYTINVITAEKKQLTGGKYEIQKAQLSIDKKYFFITTHGNSCSTIYVHFADNLRRVQTIRLVCWDAAKQVYIILHTPSRHLLQQNLLFPDLSRNRF